MAFVVCATWTGIAIGHASTRQHMLRWSALAMAMALAGLSFLLMGIYAGWRVLPYSNTLAVTRIGFALAGLAGAIFTLFYLSTLWKKGHQQDEPDD